MRRYAEITAARERLNRFRRHPEISTITIHPIDAVEEVTLAMEFPDYRPTVTADDLADAAVLLDEARADAINTCDHRELMVLDGLRSAGWSMKQIGERLGYEPRIAAAQASTRMNRLHRKFPSYEPPKATLGSPTEPLEQT